MNIFIASSIEAHEKGLLLEVAKIVEECGFNPMRWNQSPPIFNVGKYTLENLEELISKKNVNAAIFIYADDDKTWYRGKFCGKPRDNVIFEHGLFSGKLGRTRSVIVKFGDVELPTDLAGVTYIDFSDGRKTKVEIELRNWLLGLKASVDDSLICEKSERLEPASAELKIKKFKNLEAAKRTIIERAEKAKEIKILANKGLEFFGSDSSLISLADVNKYKSLKRLKMVLLSPESSWVNRGFMALRKYETIEDFKCELDSTHAIVEMGMKKFIKDLKLAKSGIKYQKGEPYFRFILVDDVAYVSTYAEIPTEQVKDLPVFEINAGYGSLYGALKKHFNDLWMNRSEYGKTFKESIDVEISAGGIVFYKNRSDIYVALVQREDGSWVLPKGHKKISEKDIEQTAIREVCEETGLISEKLKCIRKLEAYSYDETAVKFETSKINYFFLMEYVADSLENLHTDFEHMSAKWWNIKEELPFMFYIYQKILLGETIKREFGVEAKINDR